MGLIFLTGIVLGVVIFGVLKLGLDIYVDDKIKQALKGSGRG